MAFGCKLPNLRILFSDTKIGILDQEQRVLYSRRFSEDFKKGKVKETCNKPPFNRRSDWKRLDRRKKERKKERKR